MASLDSEVNCFSALSMAYSFIFISVFANLTYSACPFNCMLSSSICVPTCSPTWSMVASTFVLTSAAIFSIYRATIFLNWLYSSWARLIFLTIYLKLTFNLRYALLVLFKSISFIFSIFLSLSKWDLLLLIPSFNFKH